MYPRVTVDLQKITHNVRHMISLCGSYGIEILGVTKVFAGERPIAKAMTDGGLKMLGDSRVSNICKYADLPVEKWLIRMPMISEAAEVVRHCDVSLNSELSTLKALNQAALEQGCVHKVVLMVDLGDLREGCFDEDDLACCAEYASDAEGLELYGLGTNLTCFSFVQPDTEKLTQLTMLAERYHADTYISGGNSATIQLMLRGKKRTSEPAGIRAEYRGWSNPVTLSAHTAEGLAAAEDPADGIPAGVNSLRLGESVLFGRERAGYTYLEGMYNDAFTIEAEVIECKKKPSMPIGTIGINSYGQRPTFTDRGIRTRAICAMGRQDVDQETMWPMDPGCEILGASSDHFIVDITDSEKEYAVGDVMKFRLGYFAAMRAFTSMYVEKVFTASPASQ